MSADPKPSTNTVGILQIATMLIGIASIIWMGGEKTAQLSRAQSDITELASVVNDLAKAQASAAITDATHTRSLEEIQRRLVRLENNR